MGGGTDATPVTSSTVASPNAGSSTVAIVEGAFELNDAALAAVAAQRAEANGAADDAAK